MVSHAWPGNVRELENLIRQIVVLKQGGMIGRSDLPDPKGAPLATAPISASHIHAQPAQMPLAPPEPDYGIEPLWMTEKKAIERAIALSRGNVVAAAKLLEINPSTIYRKKAAWADV